MIDVKITGEIPQASANPQAMAAVEKILDRAVELNFLTGGHGSWAPLKSDGMQSSLIRTGRLFRSRRSGHTASSAWVGVGEGLIYAGLVRHGGDVIVPVTDRSRAFFWAKWYETSDERWKWMALMRKSVLLLRFPARDYMELGEETMAAILDLLAGNLITFSYTQTTNRKEFSSAILRNYTVDLR
jgi:phage gpG-like protein